MAICNQLNEQLETMIWLDVMHDPMLLNFHPISISHHNVFVWVLPKENRRSSEVRVDLGILSNDDIKKTVMKKTIYIII